MKPLKRFFPDAPDSPRELRVFGLAFRERLRPWIVHRPSGAEHAIIMFFHDPAEINDVLVPPNTLAIWTPQAAHAYGRSDHPWTHSWLVLDGAFLRAQLSAAALPLNQPINGVDATTFEHGLTELHRELSEPAPDPVILKNLLQNWLREFRRAAAGESKTQRIPRAYRELRQFIEEQYDQPLSLAELARKLHVSRCHLSREFQRHFGVAPIQFLLQIRMQHAAHLLRERNFNVTEVARAVGYDDVFHFSKLFKKHHGVCPRALRQPRSS